MSATVRGISPADRSGSIGQDGTREYSIVYKVGTDDRNDGPQKARTAFGIPNVGDLYQPGNDFDEAAIVVGKEATQGDSPWEWEVEVRYSTKLDDPKLLMQPQMPDNPLLQQPRPTYGSQERRILIPGRYNDPTLPASDKAFQLGILAPNWELFDPQPEAEISEPVVSYRRNVKTFVGAELMALANCVNSDQWQGAEERQLKMSAPHADPMYHQACGDYWQISFAIAFRWETWDIQLLNQGTFYWPDGLPANPFTPPSTNSPKCLVDDYGNRRIVNLTTDGKRSTSATPTFTRIRFFREIAFGSLGLI